jgi:hypothetical protein
MPFRANYYTVCATIGTINKYFEKSIGQMLKTNSIFFSFLRKYKKDFLFKLIETIKKEDQSDHAPNPPSKSDSSVIEDHSDSSDRMSRRTFTFRESISKKRRIPNKLSKQRSQFLIKSAFKLEEIKKRFLDLSRNN